MKISVVRGGFDAGDVDHRQAVVAKRPEAVVVVGAEDGHGLVRVVDVRRRVGLWRVVAHGLGGDARRDVEA